MRRIRLATPVLLVLAGSLGAQLPPDNPPPPKKKFELPAGGLPTSGQPGRLPTSLVPSAKQGPTGGLPQPDLSILLPYPETLSRIDAQTVTIRRQQESWQLYAGPALLADFGNRQTDAEEARRIIRELRPTEWGRIGSPRPVLEYGLHNGKPGPWPSVKASVPVDLLSVRAEEVRGAWCLRDDGDLLVNFGTSRADAEQAAAVCRRYGFNRVALVGAPNPSFAVLYAAPVIQTGVDTTAALARVAAEQSMNRTGIPVPGLGFVGERLVIDSRKVEVRKDRGEYVLAHGPDIFARFGQSEWSARDALKVVRDCRFTEFCRLGGVTFFLVNGAAPSRVPFSVQGTRFDPDRLKAKPIEGRWGVFDAVGRQLFLAASQAEAEQLVRVMQAFRFDQVCQVGLTPRTALKFLAKSSR